MTQFMSHLILSTESSCVAGDSQVLSLDHLFRHRIKLKKQHEISRLGEVRIRMQRMLCYDEHVMILCTHTGCSRCVQDDWL